MKKYWVSAAYNGKRHVQFDELAHYGRSPKKVAEAVYFDPVNGFADLGAELQVQLADGERYSGARFYRWEKDGNGWGKVVRSNAFGFYNVKRKREEN